MPQERAAKWRNRTSRLFARLERRERELTERLGALEQKSTALDAVLATMDDGVILFDDSHRLLAVNRRFVELGAFPPEMLQPGMRWEDLVLFNAERGEYGPGDPAEIARGVISKADPTVGYRYVRQRPDGTVLEISGAQVGGRGFMSTFADVTTAKADAERLAASEDTYRSLFENMLNGFAYCRLLFEEGLPSDFVYLSVNAAFETHTGLKDVVGKRVTEVIPGIRAADPNLFDVYERVARSGKPETFETYVHALDMWFHISVYSPKSEHFVAVFDVITERKLAERRLKRQKEILRLLTEAIDDVFWMAAPGFASIEYVSPAYERIWGRSCASLYAHPVSWAETVHPHDRHLLHDLLAGGGRAEFNMQYRIVHPDGGIRWIHHRRFPVRDAAGQIAHFASIAADVTRTKAWREQLRQAQKMEALGTFAGGIAHDFNNILTGILGFAQLIAGDAGNPELLADDVGQIKQAANRARDLVRQILTYSRSIDVAKDPVDLVPLVREIYPLIRASVPSRIRMEVRAAKPRAIVMAAAVNIHQLVLNLCLNGADAIGDQSGTIVISIDAADGLVRLEVADSGEGIDEEVRERIFDPFFTTKAPGKGSGLGLAVVKGIVDDMAATIGVESDGDGTRFTIQIPEHQGPPVVESGEGEPDRVVLARASGRVLVVDDEKTVVTLLTRYFRRMGWAVTSSVSAREALLQVENGVSFDLVITDQEMPDLAGTDLARSVRAQIPQVPIILISGREAPRAEMLKDVGINAFIAKPIDLDELAIILATLTT